MGKTGDIQTITTVDRVCGKVSGVLIIYTVVYLLTKFFLAGGAGLYGAIFLAVMISILIEGLAMILSAICTASEVMENDIYSDVLGQQLATGTENITIVVCDVVLFPLMLLNVYNNSQEEKDA